MNVLSLIEKLDESLLKREVENGYIYGDIITFCNEGDKDCTLIIDGENYIKFIQVCFVLKEHSYHLYIQQKETSNLSVINIDTIVEINCIFSS